MLDITKRTIKRLLVRFFNMSDYNTNNVEYHPLHPFLPLNARLLMLGSFPPPKRRWCVDFYYPNKSNQMWLIFGELFYGDSQRFVNGADKSFKKNDIIEL